MNDSSSPVALSNQSDPSDTEPSSRPTSGSTIKDPPIAPWPPALRVAFRFCFIHFGLFCRTTRTSSPFKMMDDSVRQPLTTDDDRWHRMIIDPHRPPRAEAPTELSAARV